MTYQPVRSCSVEQHFNKFLGYTFPATQLQLVLVIGMSGVQLQINHESLPEEREILSECEARG